MEIAVILLLVVFIVLGALIALCWLIARAVQDGKRIEELTVRVSQLDAELWRLKQERAARSSAEFTPPPATAAPQQPPPEKIQPVVEPTPAFVPIQEIANEPVVAKSESPVPPIFTTPPLIQPVTPPIAQPQPILSAEEPDVSSVPPPAVGKGSFEMRLGTYWLVRIGIVMLLTGVVFFGNYAYHNFIGKLGPGGKIGLLYLASVALLGAGAWWQRKTVKESLKNYGQVLFAGGLAAVYFTTYIAHHIPALRLIESALVDGALLLAWAGFIVWIADRKKSEVLALFAVILAYYTSVITTVGAFTLYSNLVLTLVAVVFLVRNRWAGLTFASLIATYAGYAFWRFFHHGEWHWATPEEGLWFGIYFLAGYWLVFTAAVFLSKNEKFAGQNRAAFLTLNNGAFFSLFLLTMLQVRTGGFWKFSLGYGTTLLVLAELSRRLLPTEPLAKNSYLTQGLLLVTIGFIAKFAGLQLALVLGAESVVLFVLGTQRQNFVLKIFSFAAGALAVSWACSHFERFDPQGIWLGSALGAFMVFNAFWAHRQEKENPAPVRPLPAFFSLLALATWITATWFNTRADQFPLVLAIEATVLTFSIYLLRVREVTLFGQFFLALAHGTWLMRYLDHAPQPPWWNPLLLLAITLGLSHWWQRQKTLPTDKRVSLGCQAIYALAVIGILYAWLQPLTDAPTWLALTSLLAAATTAYAVVTRAWPLAICAQMFLAGSAFQFVLQLWDAKPLWYFPLAPIAALGLLSFATISWFAKKPEAKADVREPLLKIAMAYRWIALIMSLCWVQQYVAERERVWVLMSIGALVFAFAGWRRSREALAFGAVFSVASLANLHTLEGDKMIYLPNLVALLTLLSQQQIARRLPTRFVLEEKTHGVVVAIGCLGLWRFTSAWVSQSQGGFYLTASWSALALVLFALGIVLSERIYRWVGLSILAAALGRVVLFDVWKQETIYRVLTFMALGVVLLVLGFIYNKYQEKIRKWL